MGSPRIIRTTISTAPYQPRGASQEGSVKQKSPGPRPEATENLITVVGDVENCDVIIVDDLISSGGTVAPRAADACVFMILVI